MTFPLAPLGAPGALSRRACLTLGAATAATLLGGCATPAEARSRWLDMRIVDRASGRVLPLHRFRGDTWVPAEAGMRYALRVTNLSRERLLVVLSVDGVNIVTGDTASYAQSGYVLSPGQRYELTGWRKSNAEVAAFEFSRLGQSYAARTGRPFDVGVIGAAVFRERPAPVVEPPVVSPPVSRVDPFGRRLAEARDASGSSDSSAADNDAAQASAPGAMKSAPLPQAASPRAEAQSHSPMASRSDEASALADAYAAGSSRAAQSERAAPARRERLGTAHGQREASYVSTTTFERASEQPQEVLALRYDSVDNLVALGVIRRPAPVPSPFPLARHEPGYVPDPPGGSW